MCVCVWVRQAHWPQEAKGGERGKQTHNDKNEERQVGGKEGEEIKVEKDGPGSACLNAVRWRHVRRERPLI